MKKYYALIEEAREYVLELPLYVDGDAFYDHIDIFEKCLHEIEEGTTRENLIDLIDISFSTGMNMASEYAVVYNEDDKLGIGTVQKINDFLGVINEEVLMPAVRNN